MRKLWSLLFFILFIMACENDSSKSSNLVNLVPENASIIIKTKSVEGLKSVFKNNDLLNALSDYTTVKNLKSQLGYLDFLKPSEEVLISFGKDAKDSVQIALITKYHKDLFVLDSVKNRSVETYTFNRLTISKINLNNQILYSTIKDSVFFASNVQALTEAAFKNDTPVNRDREAIFKSANSDKSVSIFIQPKIKSSLPSFFMSEALNERQIADYMMLDGDLSQDQLLFNGIAKNKDSSSALLNIFKNTIPQELTLPKICPPNADGFLSFTFSNYKNFSDNLARIIKREATAPNSLFETVIEIGILKRGNEEAIILHSLDAVAMGDHLLTQNPLETYREVAIFPYDTPEIFSDYFAPFITYKNASKYANVDDFFVFTDSDSLMKDIISNHQNGSTLSETSAFKNVMEHMSDESSLFIYADAASLNTILNTNFSEEKSIKIDAFSASALQFIQDTDFAHVNAIIKKNKGKKASNAVSEDVSVKLDNDLLTDPQFVNNHTNKEMEVVVQDVKNNLYLISNDGKVLWKKQLEGKLLGSVKQIDMFKNGRLQLAFATQHRVYVLDRNGKDVSPFPLKFNDNITQPLSVFDYENKRDYRLLITQGKAVLMYDQQGKIVNGFTYKKADNVINTQPQHFRIGKKDYIVFVQGNELEILDRVGKTRINVKNNISFSDNDVYLYDNKFTTTTQKGDLIQIDENGKMSSLNLNLGEKHAAAATSKTLVTLSDNILNIKTNRIELAYGVYTAPKIFYLKDKIYVSVTDLQTNKVYLFDSQGKEITNFPVFGNSSIELDNIDNGKGLEFVTKGDSNSVLIYHMN